MDGWIERWRDNGVEYGEQYRERGEEKQAGMSTQIEGGDGERDGATK